jgi:hypothetical protein
MKRFAYVLVSGILWASLAVGAADPFVGKWRLNPQKSQYAPGTIPVRMVIEMDAVGDGIHYRSETTYSNGYSTHSEYTADYNGREAIVTGSIGLMTPVSLKRVDSNVVVASYVRALQAIATSRREVSPDGRIMTITTTSRDRDGKVVTTTGVYERVAP